MQEQYKNVLKLNETQVCPYLTIPKITSSDIIFNNYTKYINNTNEIIFSDMTLSPTIKLKRKRLLDEDHKEKKPINLERKRITFENTIPDDKVEQSEHSMISLNDKTVASCQKEKLNFKKPTLPNNKRPPSRRINKSKYNKLDLDVLSIFVRYTIVSSLGCVLKFIFS